MSDTFIGQEIDGFRIVEELGRGGMGVVYEAEDVALARPVALKMIARDLARDESFVRRFRSEARALARINSPHITSIYALRRTDLGIFIVMEFIGGGTLGDRMERGPLKWAEVRPIVLEMITALEHAHGVGIIHRDIKPGNILITESGHVKVTDFGLAKLHAADQRATVTQGIAGTLYYMSPEQVKGERNLDGRSDLYALGVTIYEVLSGRLPFERGGSEFSTMRKIVEDPYPPLSQFVSDLPPGLEAAVMKALEKNADDRYPNAAAMREAFEAIPGDAVPKAGGAQPSRREAETVVAGEAYRDRAPKPQATSTESSAPNRKLMIGGGVLAAAVLAVLAIFLWPSGPATPLSVTTDPPGAAVYLDGRELGRTPLEAVSVEGSGGRLRVERVGYAFVDTAITFNEGQPLSLDLPLVPIEAGATPVSLLDVESSPSGAAVFINDERVGETPYTYRDSTGRPVAVRVERTGYQPWIRRGVLLQPDEPTTLRADLTRTETASTDTQPDNPPPDTGPDDSGTVDPPPAQFFGTLAVSNPGGEIRVDGQSAQGSGSFRLNAGTHTLRCDSPQYEAFEVPVRVQAGQERSVTCHFRAEVNVNSTLEGGGPLWGAIWVDGRNTGATTPTVLPLGPGTHTIEVRRTGYQTLEASQTVSIEPGLEQQTERLTFTLRQE